ncbi:MAG: hypothetical protein ACLRWP_05435 [Bilophila wadsworthia]
MGCRKCVQCNKCAFARPHAAIRPRLLSAEEAPRRASVHRASSLPYPEGFEFHMAISVLDCTGCGVRGPVPGKEKA